MNSLFIIVPGIIALCFLIFVHELAYFLYGQIYGCEGHYFFTGLWENSGSAHARETEYALSVFPLVWLCKIIGRRKPKKKYPQKRFADHIQTKPTYVKILIVFFGPFFNILCAGLIFFVMLSCGAMLPRFTIRTICKSLRSYQRFPVAEVGILPGDIITAVNGQKLHIFC